MKVKNISLLLFLALTIQLAPTPMLAADQSIQFKLFDDAQFLKQWIVKKAKGQSTTLQENKRALKISKKIGIPVAIALMIIAAGVTIKSMIPKKIPNNQKIPTEPDPLFTELKTLDEENLLTIRKLKNLIQTNPDLIKFVDDDGETFMLGFLRVSDESEDNKLELLKFAVAQGLDLKQASYLAQAQQKGYQKIVDYLQQKGPQ